MNNEWMNGSRLQTLLYSYRMYMYVNVYLRLQQKVCFFFFFNQEDEFHWLLKEEVHAVLKQLKAILEVSFIVSNIQVRGVHWHTYLYCSFTDCNQSKCDHIVIQMDSELITSSLQYSPKIIVIVVHLFICLFVHVLFNYLFIHSFIHSFMYSFIYVFICLFIYLFIYLFIHLFMFIYSCSFIYIYMHTCVIYLFIY